jgi:uncharacterized protein YerC
MIIIDVYVAGAAGSRLDPMQCCAMSYAPKVLKTVGEGQSYREISHRLGISKNTVLDIVKLDRSAA